jgi:SAM-dependent methyltransferase
MSQDVDRKAKIAGEINRLRSAYWDSRVFLTAVELDVFAALADGPAEAAAVAQRVSAAPRATERLLDALVVLGILDRDGDRYMLDAAAHALLVPGGPEYMGELRHAAHLWGSWSTLTEAVQVGTSVKPHLEGPDREARTEAFIAAMHAGGSARATEVVSRLDLRGVRRVLDVGGASGAYAMEFVRQGEGLHATVFDLPTVLPLTRRYIDEAGFAAQVGTVSGDYLVDGFGEDWDLIFLSNIVHINAPDENAELLQRAAAALAPGGRVVIQDFVPADDRAGPRFAVLFALHMLVNTAAGDTYTCAEMRDWTDGAGLTWLEPVETTVPSTLVMAQRPS